MSESVERRAITGTGNKVGRALTWLPGLLEPVMRVVQRALGVAKMPWVFLGPNLLATILFEKFGQHQPLNRQSERYGREGIDLSATLRGWQPAGDARDDREPQAGVGMASGHDAGTDSPVMGA